MTGRVTGGRVTEGEARVRARGAPLLQGDFREDNFSTAMQVLRDAGDLAKGDQKGRRGGTKGNLELWFGELHVHCVSKYVF